MADGPVEHGTSQRAAAETPEHQPEIHRATVRLLCVDGQDHSEKRQDEEVGDDPDAEHPEDEPVATDELYALPEFGEIATSTAELGSGRPGLRGDRRNQRGDQGRREDECRRIYPQYIARREQGYQNPRKRRTQQERGMLETLESRISPFDPHPGPPGEVGDKTLAGRVTRCVEETAEKDQHEELPEGQPDRVVEQRYQRYRYRTCKIGENARPLEAHAVYDRPADDASHDGRKQKSSPGQACLGGAACSLQDEPRNRHERQDVPGLRNRVGSEQGQDRNVSRRPCSVRILHGSSPYHPLGKRRLPSAGYWSARQHRLRDKIVEPALAAL